MSVFATELVCGECRNDMGAAIFEKVSSNNFTQSNNGLLYNDCFQDLKQAVKDSKRQ
jgi:hypothetical protein